MVEAFVHDPMQFYGHPKFSGAQVKNPFGDYAPASGQIQGMLKGMYDSMTSDLESKNADQAILQATLSKKKETLGEDTKTMTDSAVERDETQAQLADDEVFFEETKSACKA